MTEREKALHREIIRLENENDDLKKKLQRAENLNFETYTNFKKLEKKVQEMEKLREWEKTAMQGDRTC